MDFCETSRAMRTAGVARPTFSCRVVVRVGLVSTSLALASLAARAQDAGGLVPDPLVVARVGETPIYRAALTSALQRTGFERLSTDDDRLRMQAEVLAQLIDEQILRQLIAREGFTATDAEIDAFIAQLQTRLAPSRVSLDAFLEQSGRDIKALKSHVALEIGVNKLITSRLTPELLQQVYGDHRTELDGSLVRVSHIVLRPDAAQGDDAVQQLVAKASKIRSEVLQGRLTFADAAAKYSAGPSRRRGGDLGFLPRSSAMAEEFSRQIFALRKGDVSKPFATPSGVHIATVTALQPGTVPAERMRPQVEKLAAQKLLREILEAARAKADVFYSPGVAHFDRSADRDGRPTVVVEPKPVGG